MDNTDSFKIPEASSEIKVDQEPLTMKFNRENWQYKKNRKSHSTSKYANRIFHPDLGYITIDWRKFNYSVCEGIETKLIDGNFEDNDFIKGSWEQHELIISPEACPVFVEISEYTSTCSRYGEPGSWSNTYWVKVIDGGS